MFQIVFVEFLQFRCKNGFFALYRNYKSFLFCTRQRNIKQAAFFGIRILIAVVKKQVEYRGILYFTRKAHF